MPAENGKGGDLLGPPRAAAGRCDLIAYADRLGGDLPGLHRLLRGPLAGLFGGVHILPFYLPFDGADAGFDPVDHTQVDPRLGSWDDIAALAADYALMVDVIVNHVSSSSPQFLDWLAHGPDSGYDGMFLTFGGVFPGGATEEQLTRVYRPRPGLPFTPYTLANGAKRLVWTTFTSQQIDIDVRQESTRSYLLTVLDQLQSSGVRRVRLDAVGYAVKTPGLTSFMTPETFQFIDQITAWCHQRGMEVLVEVHSYYQFQVEIARQVDQVYDFALPALILHALTAGDADPLLAWMDVRPRNTLTVLDTHDGIGIIDVGAEASDNFRPGLLTADQIDRLVATISDNSGGTSRRATGASNRDLYQVNCTFYDAIGADDARYLLARALQLWTPGRPQIYYVGLLAGSNDLELPARSRVDRDVNRHHYTASEIDAALLRPVVQQLCSLIRFRNTHPAFDGEFRISGGVGQLTLTWTAGEERATLAADLTMAAATVQWTDNGRIREAPLAEL